MTQAIGPKTRFQDLLFKHFSQGGEVASPEQGWRLTPPPTPNSGYSVGWIQLDLSGAKPGEFDAVMGVLARDPVLDKNIEAIRIALEKKDADLTASDKSVIKQYGDLINQALASPEGKRILDRIGSERVEEIEGDIEHLKSIAAPEAKPFLESQEGQLLLGDYINQFGPPSPDKLQRFVQGKEVELNDGKNKIKLDDPLTFEKWREYVDKTRFGESHPTIIDSRFDNVKDTLGRHRLLQDAPHVRPRSRAPVPSSGVPATPSGPQGQQPAVPPPSPGQRTSLEGSEGKAAARDEIAARMASGEDPADTPAGRRLLAAFNDKSDKEAGDEALFKPVDQLTEKEMGSLMDDFDYWRTTTPRGQLLQNRVRDWHEHFYGTGPASLDETGRMLPSRPLRPIPETPAPAPAADGSDLVDSVLSIGKRVLTAAAEADLGQAIRGLQGGLNGLTDVAEGSGAVGMDGPALAVDGVFGPRTRRRLRGALAALGRAPVESAFASSFAQFRPIGPRHRPTRRV